MALRLITERVADLGQFRAVKAAGHSLPFAPQDLSHIYIKLDIKDEFENARSEEDARKFFRSVARAAMSAASVAARYDGELLEVQGSLLHVGLPHTSGINESRHIELLASFLSDLHGFYRVVFGHPSTRVEGWRATVDSGKTLIVSGRGVHGDDSLVSLGNAANLPAKHLYAQLERAEADRELKRFCFGYRVAATGRWVHRRLDDLPVRLDEGVLKSADDIRKAEPNVQLVPPPAAWKRATARALPLGPAGTVDSPSPDAPHVSFGWVMRTDLDGFSAKVDSCLDDDRKLQQLAENFYRLMDAAAVFTERHNQTLAQLPWAGDNFTAAAVFPSKTQYDENAPQRLVELSLDFEKEMADVAIEMGFGGWAHGVAGGDVHGNAAGNVFLAGVEISNRRFLVGAGEGFGRSAQAYGDIDPKAGTIVLYKPDWERLEDMYQRKFRPATKYTGVQSTIYYAASAAELLRVRAEEESKIKYTTLEFAGEEPRLVKSKPHYR